MMLLHSEIEGDNVDKAISDGRKLLPLGVLAVSAGKIIENGPNLTYHRSTTAGMSGGPVILNGKVVGISHICKTASNSLGVHIGSNV